MNEELAKITKELEADIKQKIPDRHFVIAIFDQDEENIAHSIMGKASEAETWALLWGIIDCLAKKSWQPTEAIIAKLVMYGSPIEGERRTK